MATYDNPRTVSYNMGMVDFGNGNLTQAIKVPPGMSYGRVREINLSSLETFNAVTTPGKVEIGKVGTLAKYATLASTGTLAATDALGMSATEAAACPVIDVAADAITQLEVTTTGPTGGTPAGQANVTVVVDWW